ncbi:hypothetical protein F5887DRAFT_150986 [Amanita rubescens]|nr:hypothetical protein F5887DRAFT_150986 [Amanita rubescens]
MSTRISVSTAKYSTPTKPGAAGPSSRRTVRLGPATPIEDNQSVREEPSLSKTVWSANGTRNVRPIPKESERHKRKRESSIASTSSATSLPEIITVHKASLSTPPARPRKKRKIAFTPGDDDDSQEEIPSIKRVKSNGGSAGALSKKLEVVASEEGDDEEIVAKPVLSGNTTSKPRLDPEPDSSNRVNGVMEVENRWSVPIHL